MKELQINFSIEKLQLIIIARKMNQKITLMKNYLKKIRKIFCFHDYEFFYLWPPFCVIYFCVKCKKIKTKNHEKTIRKINSTKI